MMYSSSSSSGLAPPLLRNFHLPKLQTLRFGPLNLAKHDKVYLTSHLSLIRHLSFQSHWVWAPNYSLMIDILKSAEGVEEFHFSSRHTGNCSMIIRALTMSNVCDFKLPKLKVMSIHMESSNNIPPQWYFPVPTLIEMVQSRWHPERAPTRLRKLCVFLTQTTYTEALSRHWKASLEHELAGYINNGLILDVRISGPREVHW
jgi:hypothetical protein